MSGDGEKDEAALEEERLAKSLTAAKLHGRNAFAATHATPPKKGSTPSFGTVSPQHKQPEPAQPVSPRGQTIGARGPKIVKDQQSPESLPAWKRAQLEREEAERRRGEEEERRRRDYANQIVNAAATGQSTVHPSPFCPLNYGSSFARLLLFTSSIDISYLSLYC